MRITRTFFSIAILASTTLLLACGSDESSEPMRIEDLPPESRLIVGAAGARPYNGEAEAFLSLLAFEPLLPGEVPDDLPLTTATLLPSETPRGKIDEKARLILEYRGEGEEPPLVYLSQEKQPMADLSALAIGTVDIAGIEAQVIDFQDGNIQVMWHACDLTLALNSSHFDQDALASMGESVTDACESGEVG